MFINRKAQDGFECVAVSNKATVSDLLEDRDISIKLDLKVGREGGRECSM